MVTELWTGTGLSIDDPFDAVAKARHVKVDQQSCGFVAQSQVRKQLRTVNVHQPSHRLELYDYTVFHKQVQAIPDVNYQPVKSDGNRNFGLDA